VLSLLREGIQYSHSGRYDLNKASEFGEVADDPEFMEAMGRLPPS